MNRSTTVWTVAAVAVVASVVAYAAYFDYKRRNDAQFRKQLRKEAKRVRRAKVEHSNVNTPPEIDDDDLRTALEAIRVEPLPVPSDDRERYFTEQISLGESLGSRDATSHLPAALAFFRALRVYPAQMELVMIYQKTVPEAIFNIVMRLLSLDVKNRAEGYYLWFPPSSMNVTVKQFVEQVDGTPARKNVLVATKNFAVGEVIYKEHPMVAALDADLEGSGSHCSQCFRKIQSRMAILPPDDPMHPAYCSRECMQTADFLYEALLCSTKPTGLPTPSATPEVRKAAQHAMVQRLQKSGRVRPILLARLLAHQVSAESAKMIPVAMAASLPRPPLPEPEGPYAAEFEFFSHIERLRYLDLPVDEQEFEVVKNVVSAAVGDISEFGKDRYGVLAGKLAYNAIGIAFGGGRDKKPHPNETDELREWTRTPYGMQRQVGSAFYRVSSYLTHSCTPSVRPSFPQGTTELHLTASRAIGAGDELTMAFVEVARRPSETAAECRLRRRTELATGWRFTCHCARCEEEGPSTKKTASTASAGSAAARHELSRSQDESRVEDAMRKFEERQRL